MIGHQLFRQKTDNYPTEPTPGEWKTVPSVHDPKLLCVCLDAQTLYETSDLLPADATLMAQAKNLQKGCVESLDFIRHVLEFFDWYRFPNLHGGILELKARLKKVVADSKLTK